MNPRGPSIPELLANHALITAAINRGVREAMSTHARAGNPVSTWRDGKVVWLQPAEVFALLQERADQAGEPGT